MKIAVSGTYSTGKSTTTLALSYLTGIPRTHARSSREIMVDVMPGKKMKDIGMVKLYELGIRRLTERIIYERMAGDNFLSDGSTIHEWIYAKARMYVGVTPDDPFLMRKIKHVALAPMRHFSNSIMESIAAPARWYAKKTYDCFIHLPVEFAFVPDEHRPVNEEFRALSDKFLTQALEDLKIPYIVAGGTIKNRLEIAVKHFGFKPVMSYDEAIEKAQIKVEELNKIMKEYQKGYATNSLLEGIKQFRTN